MVVAGVASQSHPPGGRVVLVVDVEEVDEVEVVVGGHRGGGTFVPGEH